MIRCVRFVMVAVGLLASGIPEAGAQAREWTDRGFFNVTFGAQPQTQDFTQAGTFSRFDEVGSFETAYEVDGTFLFDVTGGVRVWRNLAIAVGVSRNSDSDRVVVVADVPHPLFFDTPRAATSDPIEVTNTQLAVHIQAAWFIPVDPKFDVAVFAGPSFVNVSQDLLGSPDFIETGFPFDAVTVANLQAQEVSETAAGFGAGADFTYRVTPNFGAGLLIRFVAASVDLPSPVGSDISLDVAGFQIGGGARFRF